MKREELGRAGRGGNVERSTESRLPMGSRGRVTNAVGTIFRKIFV